MALTHSKSDPDNAEDFYRKAEEYWSNASRDIDGMLGGFAHLHSPDIRASKTFIKKLKAKVALEFVREWLCFTMSWNRTLVENFLVDTNRAADCGAGIGRVTRHLLLPIFKKVVMVEPVAELLEKSISYVGDNENVERIPVGLQNFYPDTASFDMIWIQWCSGHLTDSDMVQFLCRCVVSVVYMSTFVF
ncbi:hypothetical protein Y032_1057g3510 [Ancylostoma ceylanicum]|uniref:Alpha N-terminal protein methyltransferase 1 n=1 Tax=Ancylostoma ceylanicum TaxID=53326 RepID=A0A016W7Y9_9BILA|nr:hypothetical protein Y032_1057g3510 [Ancylostoma ceylanicum]